MNIKIQNKNFSFNSPYFIFNERNIFTYSDIWFLIRFESLYEPFKNFRPETTNIILKQNGVVIENFNSLGRAININREDSIEITLIHLYNRP